MAQSNDDPTMVPDAGEDETPSAKVEGEEEDEEEEVGANIDDCHLY